MNLNQFPLQAVWQPALVATSKNSDPTQQKLMVILHGRGDSPEGFAGFQEDLALPELNVLLLQAPDEYYTGYSWYDLDPNQLPGILRSRALLEQTFTQIFEQGYQAHHLFLFGFSQGCLMTLEFGARYPKKLAGYIGVSGYCYDSTTLLKEASPIATKGDWLITHGTMDDVLPVTRTRAQMEELKSGGFTMDYREYRKTHTIEPRVEFPYIREWIRERM